MRKIHRIASMKLRVPTRENNGIAKNLGPTPSSVPAFHTGIIPGGFRGPYRKLGIEPGLATTKAGTLLTVQSNLKIGTKQIKIIRSICILNSMGNIVKAYHISEGQVNLTVVLF